MKTMSHTDTVAKDKDQAKIYDCLFSGLFK